MKFDKFVKLLGSLNDLEDFSSGEGVSEEVVQSAEKILNVKFSPQIKKYLCELSFAEFYGVELYGIVNENFSSEVAEGCMVEWAISERKEAALNPNWIPIRFEDDGSMAFFDFGDINKDGEPKVISAAFDGETYVKSSDLAEDFGEYLADLIEEFSEE